MKHLKFKQLYQCHFCDTVEKGDQQTISVESSDPNYLADELKAVRLEAHYMPIGWCSSYHITNDTIFKCPKCKDRSAYV